MPSRSSICPSSLMTLVGVGYYWGLGKHTSGSGLASAPVPLVSTAIHQASVNTRSYSIKGCLTVFLSFQEAAEEWTWIVHYRLFSGKLCGSELVLYCARGYMYLKEWPILYTWTCLQHPKLCIPSSYYVLGIAVQPYCVPGTAVQWQWRRTGQAWSLLLWRL